MHEEEAERWAQSLGFLIDGARGEFRATPERSWRVALGLYFLVKRPVLTGRQLERMLGHVTFLFLAKRELLAVFGAAYASVQRNYHRRTKLWRSVARECLTAAVLMPLAKADLRSQWDSKVFMTDAGDADSKLVACLLYPSDDADELTR